MCSGNCSPGCPTCATIITTRGVRGYAGPTGQTPVVSATVTGIAAGQPPVVTQTGTVLAPVFNFALPAGAQGTAGTNGTNGGVGVAGNDSYTTLTASFVQPAPDVTLPYSGVTVNVVDGLWPAVGQKIFVEGGGTYILISKTSTTLELNNPGYPDNASPGATINSGGRVGPGGDQGVQGPTGIGTAGANGTTPTLRSGSGVPASGLGVDGDWYAQQVNSGRVVFYGKSGGAYSTQGSVTGNRLNVFTADPNTLSLNANDQDQGTWVNGNTVNQYYYNGGTSTWVLFNTYSNSGSGGPAWAFYASKTVSQPVDATSGNFTKVNFEDSSTNPPNFNNSGAWSLNTYTFTSSLTKTFTATNIAASRIGTSGAVTVSVLIVKNGATGSPLATGTLTIANASATGTLGFVAISATAFVATDTVSLYVSPTTGIAGLTITGGQFYIS